MNAHILLGSALWLALGAAGNMSVSQHPAVLPYAPLEQPALASPEKIRLLRALPPIQRLTEEIEGDVRHPSRLAS